MANAPATRPNNAHFSSGPCAKRPGWTPEILEVPANYRIGITPGSDTGAVEMALWSLLGARGVEMIAWESFGEGWVTDVVKQLKLKDARIIKADYGELPDLSALDTKTRDVVFTWNG